MMMKKNKHTTSVQVTIDPALDKYSNKVLFEEKVNSMKALLSKFPIPAQLKA